VNGGIIDDILLIGRKYFFISHQCEYIDIEFRVKIFIKYFALSCVIVKYTIIEHVTYVIYQPGLDINEHK